MTTTTTTTAIERIARLATRARTRLICRPVAIEAGPATSVMPIVLTRARARCGRRYRASRRRLFALDSLLSRQRRLVCSPMRHAITNARQTREALLCVCVRARDMINCHWLLMSLRGCARNTVERRTPMTLPMAQCTRRHNAKYKLQYLSIESASRRASGQTDARLGRCATSR